MSADDMMARLMSMAGDDAPVAAKPEPKAKAKPKAEPVVQVADAPAPVPSGTVMPVVVLDDGATFSDILGAKVCFVPPDCEQIEADAYANGVSVSDLLTLRDAITTILQIVRR
jgi:hypothetical protein